MQHDSGYENSKLSDDDLLALVYENELIIGKIEQQLEEQLRIMGTLGVADSTLDRVRKAYGYSADEENKVRKLLGQIEGDSSLENTVLDRSNTMKAVVNGTVNDRVKRSRVKSFI
jgi:hypothetical protein